MQGTDDISSANYGKLTLHDPLGFTGTIAQFNNNETIVLDGMIANSATLDGTLLSVANGGSILETLSFQPQPINSVPVGNPFKGIPIVYYPVRQSYSAATFVATPNLTDNNTTITLSGIVNYALPPPIPCFLMGIGIDTLSRRVAVEQLSVGDRVVTHFGAERSVVWTGHFTIDFSRLPDPSAAWPVRIAPHAFGPHNPRRPLFLSPDHAVFINEVLIPVRYLVDGIAIRRIAMNSVTCYHIELEEHDVLSAEGAAVESYLDQGDRQIFNGRTAPIRLFLGLSVRNWEMAGCAPLVVTGPALAQVRAMIEERAEAMGREQQAA